MNLRHTLIAAIFILFARPAFAHQDFYMLKSYGNIQVKVTTGFNYEEINKAFIIGKLAEKLVRELKHKGPIFLDFNHHYTSFCEPDYFISFDKGKIQFSWTDEEEKHFLKNNALVIRQVSSRFNAEETLKLLEYSVNNLSSIKANQKQIEYNQNYRQWRINSIDTLQVKSQLLKASSKLVTMVLGSKIDWPNDDFYSGVSYFWQNQRYFVFIREYEKPDTTLLELSNIYLFQQPGGHSTLVFDTDSTFYHIFPYGIDKVSKHHTIKDTFGNYQPFDTNYIGDNKISLFFSAYTRDSGPQPKSRTLLYLTEEDELIQDLDELVRKRK